MSASITPRLMNGWMPKSPVNLKDAGAVIGFVLAVGLVVAVVTRIPKIGKQVVK